MLFKISTSSQGENRFLNTADSMKEGDEKLSAQLKKMLVWILGSDSYRECFCASL